MNSYDQPITQVMRDVMLELRKKSCENPNAPMHRWAIIATSNESIDETLQRVMSDSAYRTYQIVQENQRRYQ